MIQEQVLNRILDSKNASLITLNNLTADFFSDYSNEFNYIKNHLQQYGIIPDKETFLSVFPDFDIIDVREPDDYLLSELMHDKTQRFVISNYNKVRTLMMNGDSEQALRILQQAANESTSFVSLQATDLVHNTDRYLSYEDKLKNPDKYFIKTGFKQLDKLIGGWDVNEDLVTIVARNGLGKCLARGTKVLMADGTTKNVEDIVVGDCVQSYKRTNTVQALHNGKSGGYKITPRTGDPFTVSDNHILTLLKYNQKWSTRARSSLGASAELVDMTVEDYVALPKKQQQRYHLARPAVDYPEKDLKIPPYILGTWLGDGTASRVAITTMDQEIVEAWELFAQTSGMQLTKSKQNLSRAFSYDLTNGAKLGPLSNSVLNSFRDYSLINNKHIPLAFLSGSRTQRLELLAGLVDTDGHVIKKRINKNSKNYYYEGIELSLADLALLKSVVQLSRGLGFRVGNIRERHSQINGKLFTHYRIYISGDLGQIPTRIPRKHFEKTHQTVDSLPGVVGVSFSIDRVPTVEYFGFMADGDHRYMLADNTLTHNTWILLRCAAAAAQQGKRVGIYSGEMSTDAVGYRMDSIIGHISNGALVHGGGSVKNSYKNYLEALAEQVPGQLWVITPKELHGFAKPSSLRAFVEKYNLDILFVDQYSLMLDDEGSDIERIRLANISTGLKLLQTTKHIPIIAAAQQNREKLDGDKAFDTTQIMGCDMIGQNSSNVIFIDRDMKNGLMKLYLGKLRQSGAVGKFLNYKTDLNLGNWDYVPDENDELFDTEDLQDSSGNAYSESDVF